MSANSSPIDTSLPVPPPPPEASSPSTTASDSHLSHTTPQSRPLSGATLPHSNTFRPHPHTPLPAPVASRTQLELTMTPVSIITTTAPTTTTDPAHKEQQQQAREKQQGQSQNHTSPLVSSLQSHGSSSYDHSNSSKPCAATAALLAASSILDTPSLLPSSSPSFSTTSAIHRSSSARPTIEIPQPQSPISLHHALDSFPSSVHPPVTKMTRPIDPAETLARDPQSHSHLNGLSYMGQRRIMTPTSRLAETAVGVREVSKKIGTLNTIHTLDTHTAHTISIPNNCIISLHPPCPYFSAIPHCPHGPWCAVVSCY